MVVLYLKDSSIHGMGVFTDAHIILGTTFGDCYLMQIPQEHIPADSKFRDYLFDKTTLALGLPTMINHSIEPNALVVITDNKLYLKALKHIAKDEEITIKYGRFAAQPIIRNT